MQIAKKQARTSSKYAIAKYTQVFLYIRSVKYHRFTANEDYPFFFNRTCTCLSSAILLAIVARQSLSLFFKQNITGQSEFVLSNIREVPASKIPQDSHCRATPFLAFSIGSLATTANHGCTCAISFRHHRDMEPARITSQI